MASSMYRRLNPLNKSSVFRLWKTNAFIEKFRLPERFKGGRLEKYASYWKLIYQDYRDVAIETYTDITERPRKAAVILSCLALAYTAMKSKPDEQSFFHSVLNSSNDLLLLSDTIRNTASDHHIKYLMRCYNEGLIRHFNFGIISFIWVDNFDKYCDLYEAQCSYLKPEYLKFYQRIVDIGFMGRWFIIDYKMKDFDINAEEWK